MWVNNQAFALWMRIKRKWYDMVRQFNGTDLLKHKCHFTKKKFNLLYEKEKFSWISNVTIFLSIWNSKYEFSVEIFLWNEIKLRFIFEIKMLIDKKSKNVFFNRLKKTYFDFLYNVRCCFKRYLLKRSKVRWELIGASPQERIKLFFLNSNLPHTPKITYIT